MYAVQFKHLIAEVSPFVDETPLYTDWLDIVTIPQLSTEQAELQEARRVKTRALDVYRVVRIVKSLPGGEQKVVL